MRSRPFVVLSIALLPLFAAAQPGTFDPSFGGTGIVTLGVDSGSTEGTAIAVQPDQRIVVAGFTYVHGNSDIALLRFLTDGTLDPSFGEGGMTGYDVGGFNDLPNCIALQPDGKILVGGTTRNAPDSAELLIGRFQANGALDSTFGDNGFLVMDRSDNNYAQEINAIAVQPDGKILAAATVFAPDYSGAVFRFMPDGSLDPTWGALGLASAPYAGQGMALALRPDGKVLLGGRGGMTGTGILVLRYTQTGQVDSTFGDSGMAVHHRDGTNFDRAYSVALTPEGRIVAAGCFATADEWSPAVVRFNADGSLDTTFGDSGAATYEVQPDIPYESFNGLKVEPDGDLVLLVTSSPGDGSPEIGGVLRCLPNGERDSTFGTAGYTRIQAGINSDYVYDLDLQADGKIVVSGGASMEVNAIASVTRLLGDDHTSVAEHAADRPVMELFPDPAMDRAVLRGELAGPDRLTCTVIDLQGRKVATLFEARPMPAGPFTAQLDLSGLLPAHYLVTLAGAHHRWTLPLVKE